MITIITPTGGRPEAFKVLSRCLARQTYRDMVQWIVIDDVQPRTAKPEMPVNFLVDFLYPEPLWQEGQNTQIRTLLMGIKWVRGHHVFLLEDDDYVKPTFLQQYMEWFNENPGRALIGEASAKYYNIRTLKYRIQGNLYHASLCQTAFVGNQLPMFADALRATPEGGYVDEVLWGMAKEGRIAASCIFLNPNSEQLVGMKGLPGRDGIGASHTWNPGWQEDDDDKSILKQWIGEDGFQTYVQVLGETYGGGEA